MKILIAIPSKNRIEVLKKNALSWVPHVGMDWRVFVEPQDLEKYSEVPMSNVEVLPHNDQGLGYAKAKIREFALKNGYTHIFKIDDDVKGFTNYRASLSAEGMINWFHEFMQDVSEAFERYPRIKAVSFNYSFEMYERKQWEVTKRVQTAFIVEAESMYVNPNISVFEDFATGLAIIAKGGMVMRYGYAGIQMGVKVGGGEGGHQSFDRAAQALREVEELRKLYPPLAFRKVDKAWKIEPDLSSVTLPQKS